MCVIFRELRSNKNSNSNASAKQRKTEADHIKALSIHSDVLFLYLSSDQLPEARPPKTIH